VNVRQRKADAAEEAEWLVGFSTDNPRHGGKREPQPIAEILSRLMSRRGYARVQGKAELDQHWQTACGSLACRTRCGRVRAGTLEVIVENSVVLQELTLRKSEVLDRLKQLVPEQGIREIRLRIGTF
jgi:hypothetical protein